MLFAQLLGISLGLSIGGTVFINTALSNLGPALPGVPRSQLQSALSGTSGDFLSHFDSEVTTRILDIIVDAIDTSFILVYVAGAVGLLASVLLSVSPCVHSSVILDAGSNRPITEPASQSCSNLHLRRYETSDPIRIRKILAKGIMEKSSSFTPSTGCEA